MTDTPTTQPDPQLTAARETITRLQRRLVESEIKSSGANDPEVVAALVNARTRINMSGDVEVVDDAGNPRVVFRNGQVVNIGVAELLDEIRTSKPALFVKQTPSGAVEYKQNPFKRGPHYSITRQMLLEKQDPALAAKLREASE